MDLETYATVKRNIRTLLDIDLDYYKDEQMRRRLDAWLVRSGRKTWPEYFSAIKGSEPDIAKLRDYLTINVSAFFRDPDRWAYLQEAIIPLVLKGRQALSAGTLGAKLRIWSAGCSIGLEPYSLAMMLEELGHGGRYEIVATDLDRGALAKAKARGPFSADDTVNVSASFKSKYFEAGGPPFKVVDRLQRRISFSEHNLVTMPPAGTGFDLVLCRNVVIYFTEPAKAELYRKFYDSLRPGGVLFVGGTEVVSQAAQIGFKSAGISFYQRPEAS
ncbi:MAG TPA: protein-glutamate O-methyltransferase CheR [Anaerolineales bacterium]|nr:protein-glutamate O-methyltransferase CheR [Anaerolineales bacterium]